MRITHEEILDKLRQSAPLGHYKAAVIAHFVWGVRQREQLWFNTHGQWPTMADLFPFTAEWR